MTLDESKIVIICVRMKRIIILEKFNYDLNVIEDS